MNSSPIGLSRILRVLLAVLLLAVLSIWVPLMPYSPYLFRAALHRPCFSCSRIPHTVHEQVAKSGCSIHPRGWPRVGSVLGLFADPDDRLINASNKALSSLADPAWGADFQRFRAASAS